MSLGSSVPSGSSPRRFGSMAHAKASSSRLMMKQRPECLLLWTSGGRTRWENISSILEGLNNFLSSFACPVLQRGSLSSTR